jgi:hypothetical protein
MTGHTTSVHSEGIAVPRGMTVELTVERRRGLGLKRDVAERVVQRANEQLGRADRCEALSKDCSHRRCGGKTRIPFGGG